MQRYCKLVILGTLDLPDYAHPKWLLLADSILVHSSRTRHGIGGKILTTILGFILDYFQVKLMAKRFKKSKKPYCGAILGPFFPKFGQKWIFLKKRQPFFKYSNYQLSCKKSEKTNKTFLRKIPTDRWTDRQIDI